MTPTEVVELLDTYTKKHPMSGYGPCHIVIDDYNLRDSDINFCLANIEETLEVGNCAEQYPFLDKYELIAEREFMLDLLAIPEKERDYWGWLEEDVE